VSGVNANEIVYADDNNDNILEAQKLGINAFFYEGFEKFLEEAKDPQIKAKEVKGKTVKSQE
jgi:FMN phosphatase YigB (HAD superfamily)